MVNQLLSSVAVLALAAASVHGQAATQQQLNVIKAQFDASQISPPYPVGFGVEPQLQALLNISYGGQLVSPGQAFELAPNTTGTLPTFSVIPTANDSLSLTSNYTLVLSDCFPLGAPSAEGDYRHYLGNGIKLVPGRDNSTLDISASNATEVTRYFAPAPPANSGPHRYVWLLFSQPSTFTPPANLSAANSGPGFWFGQGYFATLGPLVATTFFTVANGTTASTVSIQPTSSVDAATVGTSVPASTTAGSSSSAAAAASASGPASANSAAADLASVRLVPIALGLLAAGFGSVFA